MNKKTIIEKIAMILLSWMALAGIVFLEFYFMKASLFSKFPNIGIGFHLFGGFFVGIMVYYLFLHALVKLEWPLIMLFIVGTVSLAAVGWEGFEWILGRIAGSSFQGSIDNTMGDIFVGLSGGLIACPVVLMRNISFVKMNALNSMA